ncbi:MAG: translation initiation factor IF-3 [Deltaproteobacteria bacterium]|nr:translation initiation factor IF-3 [Deltaproteobacteria bacterium]
MGGAPPQASPYRINRRIRVPEIRVIGADGQQLGVLPTAEALSLATAAGLDLVEISPQAMPPVCRIMDFGKFKFDESKKARQARRRQTVISIKEIKLRPKTDVHDYDFKLAHVRRFLQEGDKVRVIVQFRGREIVHPQTGRTMLERVVKDTADLGQCDQMPSMEGRRMMMVVAPNAAALARAHQQAQAQARRSEPARPPEATGDLGPAATAERS